MAAFNGMNNFPELSGSIDAEVILGIQGPAGKPFVYEDFTPEQLEKLRGPAGPQGNPFTYEDFTPEQLEKLRGPSGVSGVWVDEKPPASDEYSVWIDPASGRSTFDPTGYGLPVLHLTGNTIGMSKDNAVSLDYVYGERSGTATVKWQGASSLSYPKKNYTIEFDKAFEAVEGWGSQKKYCLKANWIDHSHARNVVSAKLWGEVVKSRTNTNSKLSALPNGGAVDGFPCIVMLNGVFHGLYTFNIPKDGWLYGMGNGETVTQTEDLSFDTFVSEISNPVTESYTATLGITGNHIRKQSTLSGGRCYVNWDTNKLMGFGIRAILYNAEGNPYKVFAPYNGEIYNPYTSNFIGDLDDSVWLDIGTQMGFAYLTSTEQNPQGPFSVPIPEGCTVVWEIFAHASCTTPDGTLTTAWSSEAEANNTWVMTWVKTGIEIYIESITGGKEIIVCADATSEATQFYTAATFSGDFDIEYTSETVNDSDVLSSLNRLINACINSDGTDLDSKIANYLDWDSAIDYYIYTCLIGGMDMGAKNYLLSTYDGTKWFFGAYDMDSTFGLWWDGTKFLPDNHYPTVVWYSCYHRVMWLILNHKLDAFKTRYAQLRAGALSENNVALAFSNFINKIPSTVYMEDAKKWPGIPSTAANNLAQIMNWYRMRVAVLDKEVGQM